MDTKVPAGAITSINGMRVMSMWWVILGHVYVLQTVSIMSKYCSLHKAIFDRLLTIVWVLVLLYFAVIGLENSFDFSTKQIQHEN